MQLESQKRDSLISVIRSMAPKKRWSGPNGYRHLLRICLPLVASNISVSAMLFTDRLFLSHYSMEAIAASLPSGVMAVTVSSFFQGLVAYVSVFAAQYTGAGRPDRAAAALWQGLYMAVLAGVLIGLSYYTAPWLFRLGGHPENVQALEVLYYRILAVPTVFNMIYFAMSSYLAGLGRTRVVMWGNLLGALVNIPLTCGLVFGVTIGGVRILPEWGIAGAGAATAFSWVVTAAFFAVLIFGRLDKKREILKARAVDLSLLKRMVIFGSPGGFQRFLELVGFTFFAFIVGRLGEFYLAANNIVFSIEALSFFPMIGVGATISILVGQSIGKGRPEEARQAVISGVGVSSLYLLIVCVLFLIFPRPLLSLFMAEGYDAATVARLMDTGVVLLRFVVAYTVFDGIYLCCFGALSGAGDVFFPMAAMGVCGLFCMALPALALFALDMASIHSLWAVFVFYVLTLTTAGGWRYRQGQWKSKRVIEGPAEI